MSWNSSYHKTQLVFDHFDEQALSFASGSAWHEAEERLVREIAILEQAALGRDLLPEITFTVKLTKRSLEDVAKCDKALADAYVRREIE